MAMPRTKLKLVRTYPEISDLVKKQCAEVQERVLKDLHKRGFAPWQIAEALGLSLGYVLMTLGLEPQVG